MLIRVLLSGVGVYLSPFKDVWGSRIIFAVPCKVFTQANKDQQRESNHAVYSLYSRGILGDSIDYKNERDVWFYSTCKMKTSSHLGSIKDRIRIKCSKKAKDISEQHPVTPSVSLLRCFCLMVTNCICLMVTNCSLLYNWIS